MFTKILGMGHYLPQKIVTNDDLAKMIETSDDWIVQRTGIKERRIAAEFETNAYMARHAALEALEKSNLKAQDLDMIIVATCTPDKAFPSMACLLQKELGLTNYCAAFDVGAACSGFIYAISVANNFIKTASAKNVLVVSSEIMSRLVDWTDRGSCILFGDGAAACVLTASSEPGIISTHLHADGNCSDLLYADHIYTMINNKSKHEINAIHMAGREVFKRAVNTLESIVTEAIDGTEHNFKKSDITWLVPHQANLRIIEATAKKLNMTMDKVIVTIDRHANTSAASIPLAMYEAINDGRIKRGDLLLLEAFGAGLTWGSALLRY